MLSCKAMALAVGFEIHPRFMLGVSLQLALSSFYFRQVLTSQLSRNLVLTIPGVTRFVGTGDKGEKPSPLTDAEIENLLSRKEDRRAPRAPGAVPFKSGDHVRVIDGPFTDFTGVVDDVNVDRSKVKVMVSIFGRATPVELDFLQVVPV